MPGAINVIGDRLIFLPSKKTVDSPEKICYDKHRKKLNMWLIGIWRMGKAHTVGERHTEPKGVPKLSGYVQIPGHSSGEHPKGSSTKQVGVWSISPL